MEHFTPRTIVIKPVEKVNFSGRSSYPGTGQSFEGAQIGKDGVYKTGLSREEEIEFEKILGLKPGTLSPHNAEYWGSILNLRLPRDKDYRFNIVTLLDEIKFRALINNNKIAKDELKVNSTVNEFFIEDSEARAQAEEKKFNTKMDALLLLRDMTMEDKRNYLSLYNRRGTETMTDAFINSQIAKEAEDNPVKFIDLVNDPDVKVRIEIQKLLQNNVILKRGNSYYFENEVIGTTLDSVVAYFKDIKNQAIQMQAKALNKKKKKDN